MRKFLVMMILTGVVIAGCTAPAPIPTTTPQPSPTPIPSATPVPPRGMEYVIADTDDYTDPAQLRALVDSLPADWQATDEASPRYKMTITSQSAMLQQCHYNEGAFTGTLYRGTVEVTVSVKDDLSGATVITPIRMETGYLFDPNCPFAQTFITLKGASQGSANDFVYPQVEDFSRMIIAAAVSLGLDLPMENLPDRIYGLNDIVFSPDSQVLAMGGEDGIVKIMDIHTGEMRRMLMGHASQITSLDFSSDGKRLASGSADMTVRIWNLDTGEAEHVFTLTPGAEYPAVQLGFSPDDRLIGASSSLSELALWDIASEQSIIEQQSSAQIMEFLGFSSDSRAPPM